MDKEQPKLMNYIRMKDVYDANAQQVFKHAFISRELGMLYGNPAMFRLVTRRHKPPFVINDYRLGLVTRGSVTVLINLVERHIEPGTMLFVGPGTIIHPLSYTDDLEIYGVAMFDDFHMPFASGQMPTAFNGQTRDFQVVATEEELEAALNIINTVWQVVHQEDYNRQVAGSLLAALMHLYDGAYRRHTAVVQASQSREQTLFDHFIYLVNQYATSEHQINFYADKMCLTTRYLGTVIRQASGTTAKQWIDRAIITRVKIELRHSDKSVAQIAEEMNFPTPSFFCKYFKRFTGMTPLEYKTTN